jgi:DNA-binding LacI/PurR family transcriptional regulator/anti-anti-sigma regulatory factor
MYTIGFIAPYLTSAFSNAILRGIASATRALGIRLITIDASVAEQAVMRYANQHVDGWLTVPPIERIEQLAQTNKPIVSLFVNTPGRSTITVDNRQSAEQMVHHLIGLGHKRIVFGGPMDVGDVQERLTGYRQALAHHNIPYDEQLVIPVPALNRDGGILLAQIIQQADLQVSAVFAANDWIAFGCMETLQHAGIRVPEDIAITGFDDAEIAQWCVPSLTTIRGRFDSIGRTGVYQLLREIQHPGEQPQMSKIPAAMIIRQSCGDPHSTLGSYTRRTTTVPPSLELLPRHLVEILIAPELLPQETQPTSIWPSVNMFQAALEAAITGTAAPSIHMIQQAWGEALGIAPFGDIQTKLIDTIYEAIQTWPELTSNPLIQQRAHDMWAWLSDQQRSVSIGRELERHIQRESMLFALNHLNYQATFTNTQTPPLDWLKHNQIKMACYAAYNDTQEQLQLTSSYLRYDQNASFDAPVLSRETFPPTTFLDAAFASGAAAVVVLPITSETQRWGLLAVAQEYSTRLGLDENATLWLGPLAARFDQVALRHQFEQKNRDLQTTYERERALTDTVRELGCPVIPLSKGTLLIPLIGLIDSTRAQIIIETTLQAVGQYRAQRVLLDVTGVPLIDTHVAGVFLQLTQMVQLLGAETGIVGVRPEIAQSIVGLGVDLRQIRSYASLEMALRG